jgi:hypothetical protein
MDKPRLGGNKTCEPARPGARKPSVKSGSGGPARPGGAQQIKGEKGTGSVARPGGPQGIRK